ncbi:MAG: hypothetical protein HQL72_06490 [Magnetococcales bacterium]|nr:hypothetical protein [Magnetococcales bacterium]
MRIGLDFDNTLANYETLFSDVAQEMGWLTNRADSSGPWTKNRVREHIRALSDGEIKWQTLQASVYGPRMNEARLMDGVSDFLTTAASRQAELFIVSHKTQFARQDTSHHHNLHKAAQSWMEQQGFFSVEGFGLLPEQLFFTATRSEKVARIAQLKCDVFIDDLPEVFNEPGFPAATHKILFSPHTPPDKKGAYPSFNHWRAIEKELFALD